jgi:hypothetical protein
MKFILSSHGPLLWNQLQTCHVISVITALFLTGSCFRNNVRFKLIKKARLVVSWVERPCKLVDAYQCSGRMCCLHFGDHDISIKHYSGNTCRYGILWSSWWNLCNELEGILNTHILDLVWLNSFSACCLSAFRSFSTQHPLVSLGYDFRFYYVAQELWTLGPCCSNMVLFSFLMYVCSVLGLLWGTGENIYNFKKSRLWCVSPERGGFSNRVMVSLAAAIKRFAFCSRKLLVGLHMSVVLPVR